MHRTPPKNNRRVAAGRQSFVAAKERENFLQIHGTRWPNKEIPSTTTTTSLSQKQGLNDDNKPHSHQKHLEEKRQNYQQLSEYNPWGKPGGGAPTNSPRKQKFLETQMASSIVSLPALPNIESSVDTFFTFGRPGNGAPQVSGSGRLRTQLTGDPCIRFQESQNVHKSIENGIRYFGRKDLLQEYHNDLDSMVKQKETAKQHELENQKLLDFEQQSKYPFGRNNNDSFQRAMPVPGSIFNSTSGRSSVSLEDKIQKRREVADDSGDAAFYDPWGKGVGTPIRDKFGYVPRNSPRRSQSEAAAIGQENNEALTIPMGKYSGGDGSPHQNESSLIITKLPRTLLKDRIKDHENMNGESSIKRNNRERKTFMERLGWVEDNETAEKSKRGKEIYLQNLKDAMEENRVVKQEELDESRKELELIANKLPEVSVVKYQTTLAKQAEERHEAIKKHKEQDQLDSLKHFEAMDGYWNKPGNGAANHPDNHRLEGFSYMYTSKSPIGAPLLRSNNHRPRLRHAN